MKKEIMIKVVGRQKNIEGEENTIELTTEGTVYTKNDNTYIVYKESEISGMEGTTTSLKIEDGRKITMKRYGETTSSLVFENNKINKSDYSTAYGNFEIEILTSLLNVNIKEEKRKSKIEIKYHLVIPGFVESENRLLVTF
ncbi:MAG: calycin [Alkaliphilus sp.]|nr:DUF1934 domain-containing protein [bacterium AH-315-G05]MBN4074906.1 DUF1934 domain-containing protein [bacterium AH-315-E09]PHS36104.1 MAG: calycin [Alkaliphilus sp.]